VGETERKGGDILVVVGYGRERASGEGGNILLSMWCLGAKGTGQIVISQINMTVEMCGDTPNMVVTTKNKTTTIGGGA
jgi:hypothetical protein